MYTALTILHSIAVVIMIYCGVTAISRYIWYKAELAVMANEPYMSDLIPTFRSGARSNFYLTLFCLAMTAFNIFFALRSFAQI